LTSQHRSSQRYRRRLLPEEALLRQRLQLLARRHPRYGYRRIHALLRREGWACNRKRCKGCGATKACGCRRNQNGAAAVRGCPAT